MQPGFLQSYLNAFNRIEGWFVYDAALMFMAYNQLIARAGISGDTLEIGVYYGLSAITIAALRGSGRKMYAVDLFEYLDSSAAYGAGQSYRKAFEENLRSFFDPLDFLVPVAGRSDELQSSDFPHSFSFCHVDGGHSPEETYADLKFATTSSYRVVSSRWMITLTPKTPARAKELCISGNPICDLSQSVLIRCYSANRRPASI